MRGGHAHAALCRQLQWHGDDEKHSSSLCHLGLRRNAEAVPIARRDACLIEHRRQVPVCFWDQTDMSAVTFQHARGVCNWEASSSVQCLFIHYFLTSCGPSAGSSRGKDSPQSLLLDPVPGWQEVASLALEVSAASISLLVASEGWTGLSPSGAPPGRPSCLA